MVTVPRAPPAARLAHLAAALAEVGAPVFAAAFTTFASAVFLLFCLILPFKKLGIMICAHTALSAAAALIVLPAVLFVVPQRRVSPARPNDNGGAAFDLVLGADVVYVDDAVAPLARCCT